LERPVFVILIFTLSVSIFSQTSSLETSEDNSSLSMEKGLMGGVSAAKLWGLEANTPLWKPGFWAGIYCVVPIAKNLNLRPEFNFSMKGYRYSYVIDGASQNNRSYASLRLNYLDIPVLFQFSVTVSENLTIDVFIGPCTSVNLKATVSNKIGDEVVDNVATTVRKLDLGAIAGLRVPVTSRLYFNLRGGCGLLPIIDVKYPPQKYNLWSCGGIECNL
jgi:hypothetical protein